MIFLVTNDDGLDSEGIKVLEEVAKKFGDVLVVAPLLEMSGSSHSISLMNPVRIIKRDNTHYAVCGTPTDCVYIGIYYLLKKKPDFVLSGINKGPNLGFDVLYSGTVGGAMEGAIQGIPSIAFSLAGNEKFPFYEIKNYVESILKKAIENGLPPGIILNVNIPVTENFLVSGVKVTKLGKRFFRNKLYEGIDPRGEKYLWIAGRATTNNTDSETDCEALRKNFISITPIKIDLTSMELIEKIKDFEYI